MSSLHSLVICYLRKSLIFTCQITSDSVMEITCSSKACQTILLDFSDWMVNYHCQDLPHPLPDYYYYYCPYYRLSSALIVTLSSSYWRICLLSSAGFALLMFCAVNDDSQAISTPLFWSYD